MKAPITTAQAMSHPDVALTINTLGKMADELRTALQERDAELAQMTETSLWQAGRISELLDAVAAQRKVLEQCLEALQRGETKLRFDAITAIQEQLK